MKKYAIGILAVVFALAGTAFTAKKTSHTFQKPTTNQFYYSYSLSTVAGENTASNYSYMLTQPTDPNNISGCNGDQIPCVILATGTTGTGGKPDASEVTSSNLPNVTVAQKNVGQ